MEIFSFSPFPWHKSKIEDVFYDKNGVDIFSHTKSKKETDANLRLIESAPLLYWATARLGRYESSSKIGNAFIWPDELIAIDNMLTKITKLKIHEIHNRTIDSNPFK